MSHFLKRAFKRRTHQPIAPDPAPAVVRALDIPLLHPSLNYDFTWGGGTGTVHATRREAGSLRPNVQWFYLELPDGSFHEVQFCRLRRHLDHPPSIATTVCIALALDKQADQSPGTLLALAHACGL